MKIFFFVAWVLIGFGAGMSTVVEQTKKCGEQPLMYDVYTVILLVPAWPLIAGSHIGGAERKIVCRLEK